MSINAYMATMPDRRSLMHQAIDSLLPQVDGVHVRGGDNELGDANKFYYASQFDGYIFSVDDDLIYPDDYVEYMIGKIEEYNREAVISLHGRNFKKYPITSYRYDFDRVFCLRSNCKDRKMKIVGTGVLAFHSSTLRISIDDFKQKNMADIWFSIQCERQGVDRIVPYFPPGYIQGLDPPNPINGQYARDDSKQVNAVNSIKWT